MMQARLVCIGPFKSCVPEAAAKVERSATAFSFAIRGVRALDAPVRFVGPLGVAIAVEREFVTLAARAQ
jgi:hypothetical protein